MATDRPVVLVTGAARRVGAQIARTLHEASFDLALHYRHSRREMEALAAALESARTDSVLTLHADLADISALAGLVSRCVSRFGRLDAIVNNASAFFPTPIGETTAQQWDELFASNARAPFFLAQAGADILKKTSGCIVSIVDIYAERTLAKHPVYSMAKAALVAMTRALAVDMAPVRVNAVAPGAILWPDNGKTYTDQNDLIARTPLRRVGTPEEIARAVLFLIRDATFTTGHILDVDGGRALTI